MATWKVRQPEKKGSRLKVDIRGAFEVRWTGVGQEEDENWKFFYSGGETHNYGVGILMKKELAGAVKTWWPVTDRIIYMKLQGSPIDINIIQVYAPTSDHDDDSVEDFYQKLEEVRGQTKAHDITIIMKDLNAKVGEGREGDLVGGFGLREREMRGETDGWSGVGDGNRLH